MILPGMGVMSEVIACFCRKRVFGYTAVAFSAVSIAVFSFFVWAHHMFIMGISNYSALVLSLMSVLVAVPSAIKIFNWSLTMQKGSISFATLMLYALGFIGLFTLGGLRLGFLTCNHTGYSCSLMTFRNDSERSWNRVCRSMRMARCSGVSCSSNRRWLIASMEFASQYWLLRNLS